MDDFQVILKAVFEQAGINKSMQEVQTLVNKMPIEMTAQINAASTRNEFKKIAGEVAKDFSKTFDINVSEKDMMNIFDQMVKGAKNAKKEQDKLVESMAKGREKSEELRKTEEKRQQQAQNNAVNKNLEQEYKERLKLEGSAKKQIKLDRERAIAYTKTANNSIDKAISKYSYGDISDAENLKKQLNRGLSNFGDLSNVDSTISNLQSKVDSVINSLKVSHNNSLSSLNEEIKQEKLVQSQKDSFYKKNVNAIDMEIAKREEQARLNSSLLKAQMEEEQQIANVADEIREKQSTGTVQTQMNTASAAYANYEKLGVVTDKLKTDFTELKNAKAAFDNSSSDKELISNYTRLNTAISTVNNSLKQTSLNVSSALEPMSDMTRMSKANVIQSWVDNNSKATRKWGTELKDITSKFSNLGESMTIGQAEELETKFKQIQFEARKAGDLGATAGEKFQKAFSKFSGWTLASASFMATIKSVKDMTKNVVALDTAITDLRMATGGSYSETKELMDSYIALGKEMKASALDVADAANDYLRQGKTIQETNELVKDSLVLSKVGSIQSSDATTYLTTAMKGYNVAASETIGIVDKLSAVDMVSATSAGGLAEGMAEVANNANIAGVSMDKLLGYLATIGETTGEGMSSVGNSLSTMFSRMGNIKLARLDDYQNSGEDLNNVETVLKNLGISLRDDTNTFRNFGNVLDEVAGNWGSYSDVNQRAIASAIAGKNQMEEFLVLMQNYGKATEYATTATDSSGTAMKKYEAYEESITGKTEELTVNFQSLGNTLVNSDIIKFFVDLGSFGISALDGLTKSLGVLTVGGGAAGIIAFVKSFDQLKNLGNSLNAIKDISSVFTKLENIPNTMAKNAEKTRLLKSVTSEYSKETLIAAVNQKAFTAEQAKAILTASKMEAEEIKATLATASLATAEGTATTATIGFGTAVKGLGVSLKTFAASHPVLLAIVGTIGAIAGTIALVDAFTTSLEEQKEKLEEAEKSYDDAKNKLSELNDELKTSTDRLKELQDKANNGTITLVEEDELNKLREQNALLKENIELAKEDEKEAAVKLADENRKTVKKEFGDYSGGSDAINQRADELIKNDYDNTAVGAFLGQSTLDFDDLLVAYTADAKKAQQLLEEGNTELASEYESSKKEILDLINTTAGEDFSDSIALLNEYKENLLKIQNPDGTFDNDADQQLWDYIDTLKKTLYEYNGKSGEWNTIQLDAVVSDSSLSNVMGQIQEKLNDGSLTADDISGFSDLNSILGDTNLILSDGQNATDVFIQYLNKLKESGNSVADSMGSVASAVSSINESYAKLESNADLLSKVQSEIDKTGNISSDNISKILSQYPQLSDALYDYQLGLISEQDLFAQLSACYDDDKRNYINALLEKSSTDEQFFNSLKNNYPDLFNELAKNYGYDVSNWKSMAQAKSDIDTQLINQLSGKWADYFHIVADASSGIVSMNFDDSDLVGVNDAEAERLNNQFAETKAWAQDITNRAHEAYTKLNDIGYNSISANIDTSWQGLSGSDGASSSSSEKQFSEQMNWLERLKKATERVYNRINKVVGDTTKKWSTRNDALNKSISATINQLNAEQKAYDGYMSMANSVGLGGNYINAIQNGDSWVQTITDENLKNAIDEYQKWYDLAQDSIDAMEDLKSQLSDIASTRFDNLTSQYDEILGNIEAVNTQLQNEADLLEEKGYVASRVLYNDLIEQEKKNLIQLNAEYSSLVKMLNDNVASGAIEYQSEAWYDQKSKIDDVSSAIQDATKSLAEYNNQIRQTEWDAFDRTRDSVSNLIDETDFLVELLKREGTTDDKGNMNDNGLAAQALLAQKYQLYLSQANEYAEELKKVNAELANDPYNTTLLDRQQELTKAHQDAILAAQDEKDAIKDLVQDGFTSWIDGLNDTISKYKDLISEMKDAWDYQNTIAEKTKTLTDIQKQVLANQGDTSEEGKKTSQSLNSQLADAEKDLQQTEYDKLISDTEKLLDDMSTKTEELFNARMDDLDGLVEDVINQTNASAGSISETITSTTDKFGYQLSDSMTSIWKNSTNDLTNVLGSYSDKFISGQNTLQNTVNSIKEFTEKMLANSDAEAARVAAEIAAQQAAQNAANSSSSVDTGNWDSSWGGGSGSSGGSGGSDDSGVDWIYSPDYYPKDQLNVDTSIIDRLKSFDFASDWDARAQYYRQMGGNDSYMSSYDQNVWMIERMRQLGYKNGTTSATRGYHLFDEEGLGSEAIVTKEGAIGWFNGGDNVFTADQVANLQKLSLGTPTMLSNMATMPNVTPRTNNMNQSVQVDVGGIVLNGVNDPIEFKNQICNILAKDVKAINIQKNNVYSDMMGGNSLSSRSLL